MFNKFFKNWNRRKLKDKKYDFLFYDSIENEYVCLDCETTGLNPKKDEILSIGAVHIRDNKVLMRKTFNIFIKPSKDISSESIKIHHLRPVDLENAIEPKKAILELLDFIGSRPIVGYYIEFDIAMTDYGNTAIGTVGLDDSLALVVSYNGGLTWDKADILELWDVGRSPSNTGDHIVHFLRGATGLVQFGFYATSSSSNEDNDWFIDNFRIVDTIFSGIGIEEFSFNENFTVYPNPNNGVFTIQNEGVAHESSVELMDIQGRVVYDNQMYFTKNGKKQIEVNSLNSGVYILLLQSEGKLEQHRIVIE